MAVKSSFTENLNKVKMDDWIIIFRIERSEEMMQLDLKFRTEWTSGQWIARSREVDVFPSYRKLDVDILW